MLSDLEIQSARNPNGVNVTSPYQLRGVQVDWPAHIAQLKKLMGVAEAKATAETPAPGLMQRLSSAVKESLLGSDTRKRKPGSDASPDEDVKENAKKNEEEVNSSKRQKKVVIDLT